MHRIYADRINSRGMSRVFCDLRSQKTPRGTLPVNSNFENTYKPKKCTSTSLITAAPPKATTAVTTNCIGFGKFSNIKTFLLLLRTLLKDPVVNAAIIMTDTDTKVSQ